MKITATQLKKIIAEEVSKTLRESAHKPTVEEIIARYKGNPQIWSMAHNEFEDMAAGGDAEGIRDQFYPGWRDEDFQEVLSALGG